VLATFCAVIFRRTGQVFALRKSGLSGHIE
jgi:hypothetical protein